MGDRYQPIITRDGTRIVAESLYFLKLHGHLSVGRAPSTSKAYAKESAATEDGHIP